MEFLVTDEHLYIFVLTAGSKDSARGFNIYTVPLRREELVGAVKRFQSQIANRDLGFRASAASLYRLLLSPAKADLLGKRTLIVAPDGILWELPFQALVRPDGSYLLDGCAVSYAPSITALKLMTEVKQQRRKVGQIELLAMGNPDVSRGRAKGEDQVYRDDNLGSLPNAEMEVQNIARIYGIKNSRVYVGTEARESRFKSLGGQAKVVHLATHAIANNASPLYSHLLLTAEDGDTPEDGLLEAWELLRMHLNAELVVLSACETARGRVGAGEGIIGLSWSLLLSGVPTTVLSQWKVESASTSQLMVAFHRYRKSGMKDAQAMRAAALKLKRESVYEHPYYWAPFIVIGAG